MRYPYLLIAFLFSLCAQAKQNRFSFEEKSGLLDEFFKAPIESLFMGNMYISCLGSAQFDFVEYKTKGDSLVPHHRKTYKNLKKKDLDLSSIRSIDIAELDSILRAINLHPFALPSKKEFPLDEERITEMEKKGHPIINMQEIRKNFYSCTDSIFNAALHEQGCSTINYSFFLQITNSSGDTIHAIAAIDEPMDLGYIGPWKIIYNGTLIKSVHHKLSKFIEANLPDDFTGKEIFQNERLAIRCNPEIHKEEERSLWGFVPKSFIVKTKEIKKRLRWTPGVDVEKEEILTLRRLRYLKILKQEYYIDPLP